MRIVVNAGMRHLGSRAKPRDAHVDGPSGALRSCHSTRSGCSYGSRPRVEEKGPVNPKRCTSSASELTCRLPGGAREGIRGGPRVPESQEKVQRSWGTSSHKIRFFGSTLCGNRSVGARFFVVGFRELRGLGFRV